MRAGRPRVRASPRGRVGSCARPSAESAAARVLFKTVLRAHPDSSNKNDEAALALRQAVLMKLPPGADDDAELDFEARENLGMVVNRLFQVSRKI
jgi:hypothetical protein